MIIDAPNLLLLLFAGMAAGLLGYLTGLASLASYPALLAVGLSPLAANATNTLGLIGVGCGTLVKARDFFDTDTPRHMIQQSVISGLGGIVGAILLLITGEAAFEAVVPWLIVLASVALLTTPLLRRLSGSTTRWGLYLVGVFALCVYSGYFGAGAGVMFFAVMSVLTTARWDHIAITKSIMMSLSNLTAAVIFVIMAPVDWLAAAFMFVGNLMGGYVGPIVQSHIPEKVSRIVIALGGFYLAWSLAH